MEHTRITVKASGTYEVIVGNGLLEKTGEYIRAVTKAETFAVITDDTVDSLYGETVCRSISEAGFTVYKFAFPHGEA